ncbi:P-loop containing nucleoside triphosphate hydrolase protein [Coprinopsis sp. MPI-PUGE-AT-0042]|nr:P-loop containing nucleoside triphosphate hydrolase protein [Coprinopsis sp. MPI-PUGE-AT-0042]
MKLRRQRNTQSSRTPVSLLTLLVSSDEFEAPFPFVPCSSARLAFLNLFPTSRPSSPDSFKFIPIIKQVPDCYSRAAYSGAIEIGNTKQDQLASSFRTCKEEGLQALVLEATAPTRQIENSQSSTVHQLSFQSVHLFLCLVRSSQNPNPHGFCPPHYAGLFNRLCRGPATLRSMPSHTPPSCLIKLYHAVEGAPWIYEEWQGLTGVRFGLFPEDDQHLPHGWTRKNADDVKKYFELYQKEKSEDDKIRFASYRRKKGHVDPLPGRVFWREWVTSNYTTHWKIHTVVKDALTDANIHPVQLLVEYDDLETSPSSEHYLPGIIDTIAPILFGTASLDNGNRLLRELRTPTVALLGRTWALALRSMAGRRKAMAKLEKASSDILDSLEEEPLSIKAINRAVKSVANFQQAVEAVPVTQACQALAVLKDRLATFIPDDRPPPPKLAKSDAKSPPKRRITKQALQTLAGATEQEVTDLLHWYDTYFDPEMESTEELEPIEPAFDLVASFCDSPDPGVEVEAHKSEEQLIAALGFDDGVPPLFNKIRHITGLTPWDPEWEQHLAEHPNQFEPLRLQWHQLAGVHASLRRILTTDDLPPPHICGILFADDVGIGKTIQSVSLLAFIASVSLRHSRGLTMPQIARERKFMKGSTDSFKPQRHRRSYHSCKAREQFWMKDGPYHSCTVPESHRIILTSQSDFSSLHPGKRARGALPWDSPPPHKDYENRLRKTIYSLEFTCAIIDEAQSVRNPGAKHSSVLLLLERSTVRIILTATPLQTSPKDIASMGRMVGIPHFLSAAAVADEKSDAKELRKAKLEDGGVDEDDEESALSTLRVAISRRMQEQFGDFIIQRTANSPGPNGPLIALPECIVIDCNMDLTERELDDLDHCTGSLADAALANGRNFSSSRFYVDHRLNVSYPSRKDPDDAYPVFVAMEDWQESGSTKLNNLIAIIQHLLLRDDMPPVTFENGQPQFPPAPSTETFTRDIKIVVYQEFVALSSLIKSVFDLFQIPVLSISGRTSIKQRAKIIEIFNHDPHFPNIVIILDQPWSAQDIRQIIGRCYRQRQTRTVYVYHLTANDTADVPLAAIARGKKAMLDAFVTRDSTKALSRALQGIVGGDKDEEDEEEHEDPVVQEDKPKKKAEGRRKEGTRVLGRGRGG